MMVSQSLRRLQWLTLAVLLTVGVLSVLEEADVFEALGSLAAIDGPTLRDAVRPLGPLAPLVAIAANVAQAVIAPLPGTAVVYMNGAVFGVWFGTVLNLVGGVVGALACFAIARCVARPLVERSASPAGRFARPLRALDLGSGAAPARGGIAIMLMRLVPGSPFDLVSYGAGMTRIGWIPFTWGTAVGSAPHALAYAALGATLNVPIWAGLACTTLLGAAAAGFVRLRRRAADPTAATRRS